MADFRAYRDRFLEPLVRAAIADTRVVAIAGPRQAGKSTLAWHLSGGAGSYYTLDDLGTRAAAEADPSAFVRSLPIGAVIDEVQRLPDILYAVKAVVDVDPTPGRFVLTGSANLLTIPTISESLAGRMELLTLYPFSQAEIEKRKGNFVDEIFREAATFAASAGDAEDLIYRVMTGGYPEVLGREIESRRNAWFHSYVTTILQRDVRDMSAIADLRGMERLLRLCAARSSSILNETALASEVAMPRKTVGRYLGLLEQLYLVQRLPAYARERGRRITKSPKIHLVDVGLAAYLFGADFHQLSNNRSMFGGLLETLVVNEIRAQASWSDARPQLFHYRETEGLEIDLILEKRDGSIVAIEVKSTTTPGEADFKAMRVFAESAGASFKRGILLYGGAKPLAFGERFVALPIANLWS